MHDTIYLVFRWEAWVALALFSIMLSVGSLFLLSQRKPGWSSMKRRVAAALVAPVLIVLGVGITVAVLVTDNRDGWADLIRAALFTGAVRLAAVSLFIGLVTAWLVDWSTGDKAAKG